MRVAAAVSARRRRRTRYLAQQGDGDDGGVDGDSKHFDEWMGGACVGQGGGVV